MSKIEDYHFVIVSPRQNAGGSIVLHVLCKFLCELGYDAKVFYCQYSGFRKKRGFLSKPVWLLGCAYDSFLLLLTYVVPKQFLQNRELFFKYVNVHVKGCKRKFLPWVDSRTIVVYPEEIYGNPLNAKNVVRWLLYYNKIYNSEHPGSYEQDDLFYCYRDVFNDNKLNSCNRKLTLNYYDLDLYRRYNYGERKGKCYIIRKGKERKDIPNQFDGVIIDNLSEEEKVKQFNQCEYCISYDMQTAYSSIAAMCGCISVLMPEEGKKREDYLGPGEFGYGLAFGFSESEIAYAKSTMHKVYDRFLKDNSEGKTSVMNFADDCIQYFNRKFKNSVTL